jgi:hypothetical protein
MAWIDGALKAFGTFSLPHLFALILLGLMGLAGIRFWRNGRNGNGHSAIQAEVSQLSSWRAEHEQATTAGWVKLGKVEGSVTEHGDAIFTLNQALASALRENAEAHGAILSAIGEVSGKVQILVRMVSDSEA